MARIALLAAPGLAVIVYRELSTFNIKITQDRRVNLRNHDLIVGSIAEKDIQKLRKLRTVEDLFIILLEDSPVKTKADLAKLIPSGFKSKVLESLRHLPPRKGSKVTTHFAVFVKKDMDREVRRDQISTQISNWLSLQFNKWKAKEPADIEFWCFYADEKVTTGLRITDHSFRNRSYREAEREGALRPTIAAAIALLGEIRKDDTVLDPMCGSGTILIERALYGGVRKTIGCDIDEDAISVVKRNSRKANLDIDLFNADSCDPSVLEDYIGQVDVILSNLPFGKKYQKADNLYQKALASWVPLLAPGGRISILTSDPKAIAIEAKKYRLKIKDRFRMRVKGELVEVTTLFKNK